MTRILKPNSQLLSNNKVLLVRVHILQKEEKGNTQSSIYIHLDVGPPNWKSICINFQCGVQRRDTFISVQKGPRATRQIDIKSQKAQGRLDRWTDRHIILSLRGSKPVPCGRMRYAQLRAAQMNCYLPM